MTAQTLRLATPATPAPRPAVAPHNVYGLPRNEGHGKRLTAAFEALEAFPALAESRNRVLHLLAQQPVAGGDVVSAIESDVALVVSILRLANRVEGKTRGKVESVVQAVEVLTPASVQAIVTRAPVFDFFDRSSSAWSIAPERFRLHAIATQRAVDRLAVDLDRAVRDRLLVSALLHDVGKLVLMGAYPGYPAEIHGSARTPEERLQKERRELGVDHATVGGVLARRWGLPSSVASAIERHHSDDAGDTAYIRLGDMLAHYAQGAPVSSAELLKVARVIGLGPADLRRVLYDLPFPQAVRARSIEPCPLSAREVDVLKSLATGNVYKQIAHELSLSTSTVRTHLHNIYGKLGAVDRAQAVLMATERGWL